ncbi:hypothetical protein DPV78_005731 [Talaromyces pinophilus]|nr:hypothetical protein DPV78_005731 [Talaromyces pinophilus]
MVTDTDYTDWHPSDKDCKEIETCVLARYKVYAERYGDDLWFIFKTNFEEWTADDFKKCSIPYLADLRKILRTNGVYVPKRGPPMKALIHTLAQPEFHEWTESEVVQHVQLKGTVKSPSIHLQFSLSQETHRRRERTDTKQFLDSHEQILPHHRRRTCMVW